MTVVPKNFSEIWTNFGRAKVLNTIVKTNNTAILLVIIILFFFNFILNLINFACLIVFQ